MKQIIALIAATILSTLSFAGNTPSITSPKLKSIGQSFKSYRSLQPNTSKDDIEVGFYGGEDLKRQVILQTAQA